MASQISTENAYFRDRPLVPRLENGDRLTRDEFHRRYEAMPKNIRAELIRGIVYMASPVRVDHHAKPQADMMSFLGYYRLKTPGAVLADNATYFATDEYEPQPDIVFRIDEKLGGQSWVNDSGYLEGAPEMIVEISSSSVSYDLHDKFDIYERKGVQEYVVWRVMDAQIDWFYLSGDKYKRFIADGNNIIESRVFPGLRLNIEAMINDEMEAVLSDLQAGMAGKKYLDFLKRLEKRRGSR